MIDVTNTARYRITHETIYRYSEPVALCQNQLRMRPRNRPRLKCHDCDVKITPHPESINTHPDYFGNIVDSFAIEHLHGSVEVCVTSDVEVVSPETVNLAAAPKWKDVIEDVRIGTTPEDWMAREFTFNSPRIKLDDRYAVYALPVMEGHGSIMDAVEAMTRQIHQDFQYDTTATDVATSTHDAFKLRAGVCQDFAHVQIAALRSLGLPARYVSGYLRTYPPPGKPRLVGCDESHAWISVYAGPQLGWVDFDPTNAVRTGTDHIPICLGRDYDDITPMRGVVLGGGTTALKVRVDVCPFESAE